MSKQFDGVIAGETFVKILTYLDKIIDADGYSNRSYARRRDAMGRYSGRHNMNGYSYDEEMISELRGMMEDAPDERTKQEFKRFIQKIESM